MRSFALVIFLPERKNIPGLKDNKNFRFLKHDVNIPLDLKVDKIYILACPASQIYYQLDLVQTTRTSVFGAVNMLELVRINKAKILQASPPRLTAIQQCILSRKLIGGK